MANEKKGSLNITNNPRTKARAGLGTVTSEPRDTSSNPNAGGVNSLAQPSTNTPWWGSVDVSQEPMSDDQASLYAYKLANIQKNEEQVRQKAEQERAEAEAKAEQEQAEAEEKAEREAKERLAAEHQGLISGDNILAVQNQLARQLDNYDLADRQNEALARAQLEQNSRKNEADRFEAQRDLQAAALGLFGSMGNAMNGSALDNLNTMLEQRNDKENNTYWAQLRQNQDAVLNALQDSYNQNTISRRDAMQSAEKAIRDIESDWAANLNNINPELFQQGAVNGIGHLSSTTAWKDNPRGVPDYRAISGYDTPTYYSIPSTTQYDYYSRR